MPIALAELKLFKAEQISDTASANGGRASYIEAVSAVNNNIWPDVTQAQRLAGITQFRKAFFKNTNTGNLTLSNGRVFVENFTPGDDAVYFHVADMTNLESALTGSEELHGSGQLDANVSATDTTCDILIEDDAVQFFSDTDVVRISDRATVDGAGNEEFVTINATPSLLGSVVTIVFTPALLNAYVGANTRVSKVYEYGDVVGVQSLVVDTSAGTGDYDDSGFPILVPNQGGVYDDWTLTFTSATAYDAVGAIEGAVGSGSTLSDFSPNNANTSTPYFTIDANGWTGTWASSDTLTFRTTPAQLPLWLKRVVPAAAAALAGDKVIVVLDGETA